MKNLTGPITGLHFMRNNSVVIDTTHGLINFPHFTMQVKTASSERKFKPQPNVTNDALTIPPRTTKTIRAFIDHPSEWNTTVTVTPLEKITETASLLISYSMSTINDKTIAVRVSNTTESLSLIKKNTQIAGSSVVTPEQSKHIKRVDMAILSMIPQGDHDLTAYLTELHRTKKPEQQNNIFPFPTAWKSWKAWGSHPKTNTNPQRINWTQRQRKTQSTRELRIPKQIPQTIWLDWHTSNRSREKSNWRYLGRLSWHFWQKQNGYWNEHRIQGETNCERRQSSIQPKSTNANSPERRPNCWISSDAQIWSHHCTAFSKYASPIFAQRKPNGKLRLFVDLWKINSLMNILKTIIQLAPCQTQRNTWQWSHYSANQTAPRPITVCRWRTNGQCKCLPSVLSAELLPTKNMLRVSADLILSFQV